jgi:hypothetical protein
MLLSWRAYPLRLALCLTVSSCLEPYPAPRIEQNLGLLVVDGILVPNDTTNISLRRTLALESVGPYSPERGATVLVESEDGLQFLFTERAEGRYMLPPADLEPDKNYRLRINTGDTHTYTSDYVPLKSSGVLDSVSWHENAKSELIEFNVFGRDPANQLRYYMWTYDETWEYSSFARSQLYFENGQIYFRQRSDELYRCWNTEVTNNVVVRTTSALELDVVHDQLLYAIHQSDRKLYYGYSVLVHQYGITPEAYRYWSVTKTNSEELGTLFDPLPGQPVSNIRSDSHPGEPVVGFFSASMVASKRVFFPRQSVTGPSTGYTPTGYEGCNLFFKPKDAINELDLRGYLISERQYDLSTGEFIGYLIGPEECLDCRIGGGINKKPDYWWP